MSLSGTVYFDFESADCWRLFVLVTTAAAEGATLDLEWVGFVPEGAGSADVMAPGLRALAAHAAVIEPERKRRMRQALFTLRHREGDSLGEELTYRAAAKVAGVDADVLLAAIPDVGHRSLVVDHRRAVERGVVAVPSIVAHGPPLHVTTTPAVERGSARSRIAVIEQVLADDGLWGLVKP